MSTYEAESYTLTRQKTHKQMARLTFLQANNLFTGCALQGTYTVYFIMCKSMETRMQSPMQSGLSMMIIE
jgi:hypothetical protein